MFNLIIYDYFASITSCVCVVFESLFFIIIDTSIPKAITNVMNLNTSPTYGIVSNISIDNNVNIVITILLTFILPELYFCVA